MNTLVEKLKGLAKEWEAITDVNPVVEECYSQAAEELRFLIADHAKEGEPCTCARVTAPDCPMHGIGGTHPAPAAPSDELIAHTLQRVEAEWNKTHAPAAPDALRHTILSAIKKMREEAVLWRLMPDEPLASLFANAIVAYRPGSPRKEGE